MAKAFLDENETKKLLRCTVEELNDYAADGRLRQFRDGPRMMYKTDQVEALVLAEGMDLPTKKQIPQIPNNVDIQDKIGILNSKVDKINRIVDDLRNMGCIVTMSLTPGGIFGRFHRTRKLKVKVEHE